MKKLLFLIYILSPSTICLSQIDMKDTGNKSKSEFMTYVDAGYFKQNSPDNYVQTTGYFSWALAKYDIPSYHIKFFRNIVLPEVTFYSLAKSVTSQPGITINTPTDQKTIIYNGEQIDTSRENKQFIRTWDLYRAANFSFETKINFLTFFLSQDTKLYLDVYAGYFLTPIYDTLNNRSDLLGSLSTGFSGKFRTDFQNADNIELQICVLWLTLYNSDYTQVGGPKYNYSHEVNKVQLSDTKNEAITRVLLRYSHFVGSSPEKNRNNVFVRLGICLNSPVVDNKKYHNSAFELQLGYQANINTIFNANAKKGS